jgi:hypothetical protein
MVIFWLFFMLVLVLVLSKAVLVLDQAIVSFHPGQRADRAGIW